jgi:catechol 2,3-dioxygenase-like lactoylglutathione lyase family enzyme
MLELVQYVEAGGPPLDAQPNRPGAPHINFVVADIEAKYEQLRAAGVRFRNPPVEIAAGVNRGGKACYFEDPDGIVLELHEPPPHRKREYGWS